MNKFNTFISIVVLLTISHQVTADYDKEENEIVSRIFTNYDKNIRPSNLSVGLNLILNQLVKINELEQIMTTNLIIKLDWSDERLKFNETKRIGSILVPASLLWIPDMFVINTADLDGYFNIRPENLAIISFDGTVCSFNISIFLSDSGTYNILGFKPKKTQTI